MHEQQSKVVGKVIAKAWTDEAFKQRLHADPHGTLAAEGISVPEGKTVKVVEDTGDTVHMVIRQRPGQLSDQEIQSDEAHADFCKPPIC